MSLKICLLSKTENPELGTFFLHLGHEFDFFSDTQSLSVHGLKNKVDIILLDSNLLRDEEDFRDLRVSLSRIKKVRLYVLSEEVHPLKLQHYGMLSSQDYNAMKLIIEDCEKLKRPLMPSFASPKSDSNEDNEVVIDIEEEVDDLNNSENNFIKGYVRIKRCESIDQIGVSLCDTLEKSLPGNRKGVFFKYLPSYCSLVVTGSFNFSNAKSINGAGLNFSNSKEFSAENHFSHALEIPAFKNLIKKIFGHEEVVSRMLSVDNEVRGLLVIEPPPINSNDKEVDQLLDLANTKLEAIKYHQLYNFNKRKDERTGVLLKDPFFELIQNEFIRARRLFLPVTVFAVKLDHYEAIKSHYNRERVSLLLKSMTNLISSTVRHNDAVGRLGENVFGVLLPHMHREDARKKAEALLATVRKTQFFSDIKKPLRCTLSISTGTYPNHASSADELFIRLQTNLENQNTEDSFIELKLPVGLKKDFEEFKLTDLNRINEEMKTKSQ